MCLVCVCFYDVHITYIIDDYDNDTSWLRAHMGIRVHARVQVCLRLREGSGANVGGAPVKWDVGADGLTTDSTLFCWRADRRTQTQVDGQDAA